MATRSTKNVLVRQKQSARDRLANGCFGRAPKHAYAGNVDNALERQSTRTRKHRTAKGDWSDLTQLAKRLMASALLDRARNALRNEQPPRDNVAVPSVDNDLDVLVE